MFESSFGRKVMKSKLAVHLLCVLIQSIKKQIFISENERLKRAKKRGIVYESFPNDLKISTLGFLFKSGNENRQFFLSLIVHICPTKYFSFWKKTRCFMHIFQCVGNTL